MSNTVCCFHFSIVNQGKNISEAPKELENQPCRKFESCMIGKTGFGIYGKTLYFFGPQTCKKPRNSGVFGGGIFFDLPFWKGRSKKIPTFRSAFGVYHPRSQGHITQETRTISPVGLSSVRRVCIICLFCSEINRLPATQRNGVAKQRDLSMGGLSCTRRK